MIGVLPGKNPCYSWAFIYKDEIEANWPDGLEEGTMAGAMLMRVKWEGIVRSLGYKLSENERQEPCVNTQAD